MLSALKRYQTRLSGIQLALFDVDGVLTDGGITYTSTGEELKTFNAKDGQGLSMLVKGGFATGILTARTSPIVTRRAEDLGFTHVYQGVKNKQERLIRLLDELALPASAVAYMGDDLPDIAVLQMVGFACCPLDAVTEVQAICHWVSVYPGGRGAVREFCDLLMAAKTCLN